MTGQNISPVAGAIRINHNTGGVDNLLICDDNNQPLSGAFITIFVKENFDAGLIAELGFARTGQDGRWLDDVLLDVEEAGRVMYARVKRPRGYVRTAEGLVHRNEYGFELIEFTAADTASCPAELPSQPVRFFQVVAPQVVAVQYTTMVGISAELQSVTISITDTGKFSLYLVPFGQTSASGNALMFEVQLDIGSHTFPFDHTLNSGGDMLAVEHEKLDGATAGRQLGLAVSRRNTSNHSPNMTILVYTVTDLR